MSLHLTDVEWLINHPDAITAAEELPMTKKSAITDAAALRADYGPAARALMELVQARRASVGKLPTTWLMSADAAQQATHADVAQHRATYLRDVAQGAPIHDVTCSIGGDCAALSNAGFDVLGSDIDPARVRMAATNVPTAQFVRADALAPVSTGAVVLADPARRSGGRRISKPEDLIPPLPALLDAWQGSELAVKCAPGIDYSDWDGAVDVVSVAGGVKEACLYTPGLIRQGQRRKATVIRDGHTRHYDDTMADDCGVGPVDRYLIDPDGAVVRAGLVRHFAAAHHLHQIDERIAHLTGPAIPGGESGFEVLAQVGLKHVRRELAARDCGSVEVLIRGVDADPDKLRKSWKLKGTQPLAVVVSRVGTSAVAFICGPREQRPVTP
ncbi:SAM-dependent methyltransferase [Corynebacterium sp. TAE3-ERU12]|uniref:class I SAM-dependent methyltransferase n=1 Tax=Corynebacterium sp. TAE3-ERU12 TaxID=2849491 RepID=UPI001C43CDD2|nr:SAM-dependent methyltransferase [Corynebacterium sp. TAE3-ERU12]MBV7295125.1 SAM-dependent methyltransferase [Corynebacterium sp. TAE3-ERU12]